MRAATAEERRRTVAWPKMRPRFVVEVDCSAEHVMEALRAGLAQAVGEVDGRFSERHGVLEVPADESRFWSTELGITVEDAGPQAGVAPPTRVFGVFSPHPEIWTGFVFAIGTLSAVGVFGTMYAVVQLSMGHAPWCLLASLIAALAGGLVYTTTLVGQGLAADEMYRIRSFLDDCLEQAEARAKREPATARESAQL